MFLLLLLSSSLSLLLPSLLSSPFDDAPSVFTCTVGGAVEMTVLLYFFFLLTGVSIKTFNVRDLKYYKARQKTHQQLWQVSCLLDRLVVSNSRQPRKTNGNSASRVDI